MAVYRADVFKQKSRFWKRSILGKLGAIFFLFQRFKLAEFLWIFETKIQPKTNDIASNNRFFQKITNSRLWIYNKAQTFVAEFKIPIFFRHFIELISFLPIFMSKFKRLNFTSLIFLSPFFYWKNRYCKEIGKERIDLIFGYFEQKNRFWYCGITDSEESHFNLWILQKRWYLDRERHNELFQWNIFHWKLKNESFLFHAFFRKNEFSKRLFRGKVSKLRLWIVISNPKAPF